MLHTHRLAPRESSPSHEGHPSPSRHGAKSSSRRTLTKALELARDAVALDASEKDPQAALVAYACSVELLQEVLDHVRSGADTTSSLKPGKRAPTKAEELEKLQLIHDTYANRMQVLKETMDAVAPRTPPPPIMSYIVPHPEDHLIEDQALFSLGTSPGGSSSSAFATSPHPYSVGIPQQPTSPSRRTVTKTLPFAGQFISPRAPPAPPTSFVGGRMRSGSDARRTPSVSSTNSGLGSLQRSTSRSRSHADLNAAAAPRPPPTAFAGPRSLPPPVALHTSRRMTGVALPGPGLLSAGPSDMNISVGRSRSVSQPGKFSARPRIPSHHQPTPGPEINIIPDRPITRPATAPSSLPPTPPEALRRPYHTMHLLRMSMTSKSGGYLTRRLYIPNGVWSQTGVKLQHLSEKVRVVEVLWVALEELHQTSIDFFGNVSSWTSVGGRKAGTSDGAAWLVKLEEFSKICDALVQDFGKKLGVGEGFVFKKGSGLGSKFVRRLDKFTNGKNMDSPAAYANELSKLFSHAQLFDEHIRALLSNPVAPAYAGVPPEMRAAVKIKLQRSSDFFASVVLMFVVRDLSQLLDKYARECEKALEMW